MRRVLSDHFASALAFVFDDCRAASTLRIALLLARGNFFRRAGHRLRFLRSARAGTAISDRTIVSGMLTVACLNS